METSKEILKLIDWLVGGLQIMNIDIFFFLQPLSSRDLKYASFLFHCSICSRICFWVWSALSEKSASFFVLIMIAFFLFWDMPVVQYGMRECTSQSEFPRKFLFCSFTTKSITKSWFHVRWDYWSFNFYWFILNSKSNCKNSFLNLFRISLSALRRKIRPWRRRVELSSVWRGRWCMG